MGLTQAVTLVFLLFAYQPVCFVSLYHLQLLFSHISSDLFPVRGFELRAYWNIVRVALFVARGYWDIVRVAVFVVRAYREIVSVASSVVRAYRDIIVYGELSAAGRISRPLQVGPGIMVGCIPQACIGTELAQELLPRGMDSRC